MVCVVCSCCVTGPYREVWLGDYLHFFKKIVFLLWLPALHLSSCNIRPDDAVNIKHSITVHSILCSCTAFVPFWSRDFHPVQNLLLCTKFHENLMIFHRDMAIYWFSKWQPSTILELFYHHTRPPTKSLLLAAVACRISCQSEDIAIWIFLHI